MLTINVEDDEFFNEVTNEFELFGGFTLQLEHSLVSLSKWESKYQKPFLSSPDKTPEEIFDYVLFMILDETFDQNLITKLSQENFDEIQQYIESTQSATTFGSLPSQSRGRPETITAELIYYWLVGFNIPFECENWHLNRLFALVRICNIKNSPQKKMSKHDIASRNRDLNAQRKAQLGTSG